MGSAHPTTGWLCFVLVIRCIVAFRSAKGERAPSFRGAKGDTEVAEPELVVRVVEGLPRLRVGMGE